VEQSVEVVVGESPVEWSGGVVVPGFECGDLLGGGFRWSTQHPGWWRCVVTVGPLVRAEALRLLAVEGCSAREVGRRLGVSDVIVGRWASVAGMQLKRETGGLEVAWPPVLVEGSLRLCLAQRVMIRCRLEDGYSMRAIARGLGVAPSTISREIARGNRDGFYDPGWSQRRADRARCRPRPGRVAPGTELRRRVVAGLNEHHSPQQVASRLRRDFPGRQDLQVSAETIYQALYVQGRGALRDELRLVKALRSGRTSRQPRSKLPRNAKPWLAGAHISQRPAQVAYRAVPGHWEGDLVVGPTSRSALITLVERSSRFCLISRLPTLHTSQNVIDRLTDMVTALPAALFQTLTWDQGSEMAQHHRFTIATDCQVFFCDPHSPWQRGSNENLNGLIRDFYPKGTHFGHVTDAEIAEMQRLLNTRPRKTLDYRTPAETLDQLITVALTT
jgi:transposase, IS30 family